MPSSTCNTTWRTFTRNLSQCGGRRTHHQVSANYSLTANPGHGRPSGDRATGYTPTCFWYRTIPENSAMSRLAPPTSAPSTFGSRMNPAMLPDFTEPP